MDEKTINKLILDFAETTKISDFLITFINSEEYHHIKQEIWKKELYRFESKTSSPLIIDAGAHIGIATLYFKHLFPDAIVVAIEANPVNTKLLEQNINQNALKNISIVTKGLSANSGQKEFFYDKTEIRWFSTGSFLEKAWNGLQETASMIVPTTSLDEIVSTALAESKRNEVDLLKLDIEGSEQAVLKASKQLKLIKQIIMEFHPTKAQDIIKTQSILRKAGFNVETEELAKEKGLLLITAKR